jgi:ankyrin repeat protein
MPSLIDLVKNGKIEKVKYFLKTDVRSRDVINSIDYEGLTALMCSKNVEMTRALLEGGADSNAVNSDGNTALMFSKSVEITRVLLEAGAIVNESNNFAHKALKNAPNKSVRKLLIEAGAK